ncbi:anti-sigma factor family protein [Methylobacterium brachythecii]|uniref:Anti-sigma factor RsiW n=1 Tax=Methylobacterium brachythecii TaxID=1176177 RepID=A0A7W6AI89_9HYPH|nr:anti-sigma factor [Methylobacterium brachythecii]MBB3901890.1 anti-sigma factor RsiW [Methylobacterium brachythecii]GLS43270.1 transcriptional regulator, anti-sigma factor [Methylobacterium brachythecii]
MIDPITESDLAAYVDDELGAMRRLEVESHLAKHPEDAARVMADLRDRDALREIYASMPGPGPERLRTGARRLDRSMAWQRVGARLRRAAAIAVLVGAGWLAHTEIGTFGVPDSQASTIDPALVEEAQQARQAVLVRAKTHSQRAVSAYDRADLEAATGLSLPSLPEGWSVRDVQVFPSRSGTGVEIAIDAGDLGDLSLFATRKAGGGSGPDGLTRSADGATAYWRYGQTAYALSGAHGDAGLSAAAGQLSAK